MATLLQMFEFQTEIMVSVCSLLKDFQKLLLVLKTVFTGPVIYVSYLRRFRITTDSKVPGTQLPECRGNQI